jgi:SpoVK/Ycf46/Vps4 family AAA+-type ATPase
VEIERLFTVVEFDLPDREKIIETIKFVCVSAEQKLPENGKLATIVESALGLSAHEAENAFSLSLSSKGCLDPKVISGLKAQLVKKNASLDFSTFTEGFDSLGGLDNLKDFASKTIMSPLSRGLVILGVPGTGKSHFAKALGNEVGLPTLLLDFGRMFGSLVGQSEERIRQALDTADAMSPCILFIDEIEKGLGGMASSNTSDGGTGSRVFSTFLTWLQDHKTRVYVIATSNNVQRIDPEYLRAERWDALFFVDLPTEKERMAILKIWMDCFKLPAQELPSMVNWTGAEIRSLCRIAAMLKSSLVEAAEFVVPLAISSDDKIKALRDFAKDRTLPASTTETNEPRRRKIKVAEPAQPPFTSEEINALYEKNKAQEGGKQ